METGEPASEPEGPRPPAAGPPVLVVMVGPPGTGKSHLVRRLAARVPLRVVESDEIRHRLAGRPTYTPLEHRRVYFVAHREIGRLLRRGENVAFDATSLQRSARRTACRIAESAGARVLIVRTVAPEDVVARRMRDRREGLDPADWSEADWAVYLRMRDEFQEITRPHLVVDTSRDLEPALAEIVRRIQNP